MNRIEGHHSQPLTPADLRGGAPLAPTSRVGAPPEAGTRADESVARVDRRPQLFQKIGALEQADFAFRGVENSLAAIDRQLNEIRELLAKGRSTGDALDTARAEIDRVLGSVDSLLESQSLRELGLFRTGPVSRPVVTDRNEGIEGIVRINGTLPEGVDSLDVDLDVTASAQQAALYLSFGAGYLSLSSPTASFDIEITGTAGSEQFSFPESATVSEIQFAINAVTEFTGVSASLSGHAVRIDSTSFGSDEFVSVRIINPAGQVGGINTYADDLAHVDSVLAFYASPLAAEGVADFGQDLSGTIRGNPFDADGLTVRYNENGLNIRFTASQTLGQTLGTTRVFTLSPPSASADPASAVRVALEAVNSNDATLEQIDALLGAIGSFAKEIEGVAERGVRGPLREAIAELKQNSAPPSGVSAMQELRAAVTRSRAEDVTNLLRGSEG